MLNFLPYLLLNSTIKILWIFLIILSRYFAYKQNNSCQHIYELIFSAIHDDFIKWKHFPRYWPFVLGIHWSTVNSTHKGQWRGTLMFSLIYVWTNGWVNNREAGDLRRHHAHCGVTVMIIAWSLFRTRLSELNGLKYYHFGYFFKENIKAPRHWPLCGEFTGTGKPFCQEY